MSRRVETIDDIIERLHEAMHDLDSRMLLAASFAAALQLPPKVAAVTVTRAVSDGPVGFYLLNDQNETLGPNDVQLDPEAVKAVTILVQIAQDIGLPYTLDLEPIRGRLDRAFTDGVTLSELVFRDAPPTYRPSPPGPSTN